MHGLEFLGLIAALVVLAIPVSVVVLLFSVSKLKARVASLERDVAAQAASLRAALDPGGAAARPQKTTDAPEIPLERPKAPVAPEAPKAAEKPAGVEDSAEPVATSGPWSPGRIADTPPPAMPVRPAPARVSALGEWLKTNWVYAVSAISLALAGIFFVQYGIEKGLLPPPVRVMAAILFGAALIGAGEWVRRRWGDSENEATAYLPSTFSGAGLVSIFGGVLAARQLYDLIGAGTAFAGLVATALLAVVLGWFYGPFLAAVGLIGAAAAPFVVGGSSEAPYWLYGYFALIAAAGLAVDTIRRWAWVSVLALVLGYAGSAMVLAGTGGAGWFGFALVALAALAICIPARGMPDHSGAMVLETVRPGCKEKPKFPTLLAGGAVAATSVALLFLPTDNAAESTVVFLCLAVLTLALTIWSAKGAPALSDLTLAPAAAYLIRLGFEGLDRWPLARDFGAMARELREPETAAPMTAAMLLGFALAMTLAAASASNATGRLKPFWAAGAALMAPLAALVLELFWSPSDVVGAYGWALHVIGLAVIMVGMATMFARKDGEDMRRAAYATLSALSLIALALFLLTTKGALTLALAALVVVAAALDRRFRLPEMGWFIQAGVIVLSWRLVVDPGLLWAVERAALWEAVASYGGAAAAMAAGLWLMQGLDRKAARVFLESAFAAYAALFANVLITRWLTGGQSEDWAFTHWALTLNALPWLILMLTQFYRLQLGGALRWLRWGIAAVAGSIGFGALALSVLPANPLFALIGTRYDLVYGPPVFDTLLVAYGLPGLTLVWATLRMPHLARWLRWGLTGIGAGLLGLYAVLEIRRFWQGDDISLPGIGQYELYSYTIALMILGAALLYQAIARRSQLLRRIAMGVIALTIAKVFLIDISGLTGLTRVFSFLALGLSLAGLAFLNRWAMQQQGDGDQGNG